jgi:hypothetical protein
MSLNIYSDKDIPRKEWSALSKNSFFSSTAFASLWRTKRGEPIYCVDTDGGKMAAGIGGVLFGRSPVKRYDSMPDGFSGGPYFSEHCNKDYQRRFLLSLEDKLRSERVIRAAINNPPSMPESRIFKEKVFLAHILELTDANYLPPRKEVRKHIRGARERGGRVELFNNESDLELFYELAQKTKKRHNQKMAYPIEFFSQLLKVSSDCSNVLWLKVMLESKMIASQISFFEKGEATNWQFYYDKKYSYYKPGYLLLDYAINYSIEKGIKYFSMGSTPGNLSSLVDYKERWGGRERQYLDYQYFNWLGKFLYGWRNE